MTIRNVGISTEIIDRSLSTQPVLPKNVSLIIDRAYSGPSNAVYLVSDFGVATSLYGEQSPLIQQAKHALSGGAEAVALYRIGGSAAVINNVVGEYTTISTVSETVTSGQDLSLYIGPRPNDASKSCVIVWQSGKIVYSNVPGSSIDSNVIIVDGFNADTQFYRVGTVASPVAFADVIANLLDSTVQIVTATSGQTSITLTTPVVDLTSNLVVSKTVGLSTVVLVETTDYTKVVTSGNLVSITLTTPAVANSVYTLNYTTPTSAGDITANEITYVAGANSLNSSLNSLYELYDKGFEDLENIKAKTVTIQDLFNCRNIAAGDDASSDRLTYVFKTETDAGYDYEWSAIKYLYQLGTDPLLTTTDPLLAAIDDNGQPIIAKKYSEVDFAHRLATWCYTNSTTADFIHATIGAVQPKSTTTIAVKRWIGTLPQLDFYGNIITNGTGLLGNRFMTGTTTRLGGFYATDTGFPDGTVKQDSLGAIVDIGKYLSIATTPCYTTADLLNGRTLPLVNSRSFAAAYAGLISTVTPGDSTTNRAFNQIVPLFTIKDSVANSLSTAGYVALVDKQKGVTIYSGDLATNPNSDFDYISTAIAVANVVGRLDTIIDPFLGRGLDFVLATALNNAIDTELKAAASAGVINGYEFSIVKVGPSQLAVALKLRAKEELRVVAVTIALTPDTTFSIQ